MSSPIAGVAFINAYGYAVYGQLKIWLFNTTAKSDDELELWKITICGAGCGFATSIIVSPIELFKARLQVQYNTNILRYRSSFDCAKQIFFSKWNKWII